MKDFFISYSVEDGRWAAWVAFQLEASGYSVDFAEWDLLAGQNYVLYKQKAASADRILLILSEHYFASAETQPEWAIGFAQDPHGTSRRLLPVRVDACRPKGLLGSLRSIDLYGKNEDEAIQCLIQEIKKVQHGRHKPNHTPTFPTLSRPFFPGQSDPDGAQKPSAHLEMLLGRCIDTKYRIVGVLGQGGMGVVFAAVREDMRVAIKFLQRDLLRHPGVVARFKEEARAINLVKHPGIVAIIDWGELQEWGPFLVMEYLEGEILSKRLEQQSGRIPREQLYFFWQIAATMADVHAKRIIHRDLKPENIMLIADPFAQSGERAKVLDFGIALVVTALHGSMVEHISAQFSKNEPAGTPNYMAPELWDDEIGPVSDRTDVYSLGVMLYQCLCGRLPFRARQITKLMHMHVYEQPNPLAEVEVSIPAELAALVHRMLAKQPTQRPTMTEIAAQLRMLNEAPRTGKSEAERALTPERQHPPMAQVTARLEEPWKQDLAPTIRLPEVLTEAPLEVPEELDAKTRLLLPAEPTLPSAAPTRRPLRIGIIAVLLSAAALLWILRASFAPKHPQPSGVAAKIQDSPTLSYAAAPLPHDLSEAVSAPALPPPDLSEAGPVSPPPAPPKTTSKQAILQLRWTLQSAPSGATVLDEQRKTLGTTPWELRQAAKSNTKRTLLLRLGGYHDTPITLSGERDEDRVVKLQPSTPPRVRPAVKRQGKQLPIEG